MSSLPPIDDTNAWAGRYLKYQELETNALRRNDVAAANSHGAKLSHALDMLAMAHDRGKEVIKGFLSSHDPAIRCRAARRVLKWAPNEAIPVLAGLLYEELAPESSTIERVHIRMQAEDALAAHFSLPFTDLRALPDRLAELGIKLPDRTVQLLRE